MKSETYRWFYDMGFGPDETVSIFLFGVMIDIEMLVQRGYVKRLEPSEKEKPFQHMSVRLQLTELGRQLKENMKYLSKL